MKNKSVQNCRFVHIAKFHCFMTTLNRLFKMKFKGGGLEKSPHFNCSIVEFAFLLTKEMTEVQTLDVETKIVFTQCFLIGLVLPLKILSHSSFSHHHFLSKLESIS